MGIFLRTLSCQDILLGDAYQPQNLCSLTDRPLPPQRFVQNVRANSVKVDFPNRVFKENHSLTKATNDSTLGFHTFFHTHITIDQLSSSSCNVIWRGFFQHTPKFAQSKDQKRFVTQRVGGIFYYEYFTCVFK